MTRDRRVRRRDLHRVGARCYLHTEDPRTPREARPRHRPRPILPTTISPPHRSSAASSASLFSPSIIVGIVPCIIAIMLARSYAKTGGVSSMARIGKVLGIIGLILSALALVLFMTIGCSALAFIGRTAAQDTAASTSRATDSGDEASDGQETSSTDAAEPEEIELSDEERQAMVDEVAAYLDPLMAQDDDAVDELADWCNDRFEAVFGCTLDDAGVDAREFVHWMLDGMSWQQDGVYGYDDGAAAVSVAFKNSYHLDFQAAFEYLIEVYIDRGGDIKDEQKVGRVFKAAQEMG